MIREKIKRFIKGTVFFTAENGFSELFLERCKKLGLSLNCIEKTDSGILAFVNYKDMKYVFEAAKKSGAEITVLSRNGLPHIFTKYKHRFGIPIGLLIGIFITAVLSSVIWSIDISGNEKIPTETVESLLKEVGIEKGCFRESINCDDAEFYIYNRLESVSWISVYVAGSRMFVEMREREETVPSEEKEVYSNIVASKDGEVVRADIFTGVGKIYPGSAVLKGDLLVSGVVTMRDESVKFVDSSAYISARTKNTVSCIGAKKFTTEKIVDCKDRYFLYFFGIPIPLSLPCEYENLTDNGYFINAGDIILPLGVIRENRYSLRESEIILSEDEAALITFYDFSSASLELMENAQILNSDLDINFTDSQVFIDADFLCIENIAQRKIFTVEDTEKINPNQ